MARQTSKNRWVNGKRTLKWFFNPSEFAGGSEMGTAVALGHFVVYEGGKQINQRSCYNSYEKDEAIRIFKACGDIDLPQHFNEDDVLQIIYKALREAKDNRINDVTTEKRGWSVGDKSDDQIILTTDNGDEKQCWVIEACSIVETEAPRC